MNITTRYDLGQTVWGLRTWNAKRWKDCPLCDGRGSVPIGTTDRTASCPDCLGRGGSHTPEDVLTAEISKLTIGQINVQLSEPEDERTYMCVETGVGSGSVHKESNLYPSSDGAEQMVSKVGAVLRTPVPS